jgi:hypothetical protein
MAALAAKLPKPIASAFRDHAVVVISVYTPNVGVDQISMTEAQAGAGIGGAGFVAVDASQNGTTGELTRAFGVLSAPTTLVLSRNDFTKPATTLDGFVDRETVAQAALNANPSPGASQAGQSAWAKGAEAVCAHSKLQFSGLGEIKTAAQLKQATPKVTAITTALMGGLHKLEAPAGRAADVKKFLSLAQQDVDVTLKLVAGAVKKDPAATAIASARQAAIDAQVNSLAVSLGAPSCAQPL